MQDWHIYIVECSDKSYYTGITTDLVKRVDRHNSGNGAKYTRARRPVSLVYSEECISKSEAKRREVEIKSFS
ncbi:MAG: GIY-YIG nuclease family protein, partial [Candidatus Omnitrophota bacterium]